MEKTLLLTVKPGVHQYVGRMDEVKTLIADVLDVALIDFLMVSSVFKKYNQFANPDMPSEDAIRVSECVKELQYMDVFSQKLNHIISLNDVIHDAARANGNNQTEQGDQAGFILKLNYCQALVAAYEFQLNAEDLRQNLYDLHDHIIDVTGLDYQESVYFKHQEEVKEKLMAINNMLDAIQHERYHEAPIAAAGVEGLVGKISNIYSMASERFVLVWLIKHTEITVEELLKQYMRKGFDKAVEETDIF